MKKKKKKKSPRQPLLCFPSPWIRLLQVFQSPGVCASASGSCPSRDVMSRSPHAALCRQPRPRRQGGLGSRPRALSGRASHALAFRSQNRRDLHDLHDLHGAQWGGAPWNTVWPPPGGRPGSPRPRPRPGSFAFSFVWRLEPPPSGLICLCQLTTKP